MIAIEKNFLKVIKRLVKEKFDFETIDNNGETPVFYLASAKRKVNKEIETYILKKHINLRHKNH